MSLKYIKFPATVETTTTLNMDKILNYTHYMIMPLKCVACWGWYKEPRTIYQILANNIYLSFTLLIIMNVLFSLIAHIYTEWTDVMSSLDLIADCCPLVLSIFIISYFAIHKTEMYKLMEFMNSCFKWHSARGLTNMTMIEAYRKAKKFAYFYTACTLFSVTVYVFLPVVVHLWTNQPLQPWIYRGVTARPLIILMFLRQCITQALVALAVGQLGAFFASNAIIICGQLDLLCCCLRNARYTAMLQHGVCHEALASQFNNICLDEEHSYSYNEAEMLPSCYHYDEKLTNLRENKTEFDIYNSLYDDATFVALQDCARISQVVKEFNERFEKFISPLLVLRVVQVTLYLCTLLYGATLKFDMVTVEYLAAVAFDIYIYCYFGNQITLQADRVSTAGYQTAWSTMSVRPRRLLLNILLANRNPMLVKAGRFLPMNLQTFVLIIKTSFSYYTLLVNVNN